MDAAAIQMQIQHYQSRIQALESQNAKLRDNISRITSAAEGYKKKHGQLETYLMREKLRANEFRWLTPAKAASSYADILAGFSEQGSRQQADDAFNNISIELAKQKEQFEEELKANCKTIGHYNQEIAHLRSRMMSLS